VVGSRHRGDAASDKVSDRLIELVRPMSGLGNRFPSFHVPLRCWAASASVPRADAMCAAALGAPSCCPRSCWACTGFRT
jgi:hypothetical protein